MTVSILRTAEAWWVQTPTGAAHIAPRPPPPASCWPTGPRSRPPTAMTRCRGQPAPAVPGHRPLPGNGADDQLRLPRQRRWRDQAHTPLAFFRKASGSISGPLEDIVKPRHVRLLDYEVEIGLVIGRDMPVGTTITEANLSDYVCG